MYALMIRAAIMTMLLLATSVALIHVHEQEKDNGSDRIAARQARQAEPATSRINAEKPVVLPTINVRISPDDLARIGRESVQSAGVVPVSYPASTGASRSLYRTLAPALPRVGLDMPYYSFGQTLTPVHKD